MNIIETYTKDEIYLSGLEYKSNKKEECYLFIPGLGGNYLDNRFICEIANTIYMNNMNIVIANTRGSFNLNYSHPNSQNGYPKEIGLFTEMFDDCIYDIDAWIEKLKELGYNKITLIGHSVGNNKIIYYYNQIKNNKISDIIMISPSDYAYRMKHKPEYNDILNKALENCKNNKEKELLHFDFYYKYSYSMADFLTNNNLDNFPVLSKNLKKMTPFNRIDVPISIIYGSEEKKYTSNIDFIYANSNKNCCIDLIEGANHSFNGYEKELSKKILKTRR